MEFRLERASGRDVYIHGAEFDGSYLYGSKTYSIEINDLHKLLEIAEIEPDGIIIYKDYDEKWKILIYDGYVE